MLELHILGTSSSLPAQSREVSGSILETPNGIVVIDCGEGFQSRLAKHRKLLKLQNKRIKSSKISGILLTHGHLDHTWGLLPWLKSLALGGRQQSLFIAGPTSSQMIDALLDNSQINAESPSVDLVNQYEMCWSFGAIKDELGFDVDWYLTDGERWVSYTSERTHLFSEIPDAISKMHIQPIPTSHSVPSCAWKISTSDRLGVFNREKAKNLPEETKKALSSGEDVTYDGVTFLASEFRGPVRKGVSIIISGDTAEQSIDASCDLLVHEATYLSSHQALADQHLHSTAAGAARTAKKIGAKYLALTHYSARIDVVEASVHEANQIQEGTIACQDGDRLILDEEGNLKHISTLVNQD